MTSRTSSLRVNRGSVDGVTFSLALEVNSSVSERELSGEKLDCVYRCQEEQS